MNKATWSMALSALALICAALSLYFSFSSQRIAYVDSAKLLDEYQGMIDAREAFQKKSAIWQSNIDTLQSELTAQIMDYEKEVNKMTSKEKELTQELIKSKQQQFQQYQRAIQQQAQQEDAQMTQQVLDKVNAFLKTYGEQKGYDIVFGTGQGNIVYAKEMLDITDEALDELNNQYMGL